jgi:acyl-CoA synthetase (AMP-forming)/AMP-acid ligase II
MEQHEPGTLPQLLSRTVAGRGSHEAVVMTRETVSYAELERRSAKMARALLALGAGKGTRIAMLAPDGVFWLTAFLAGLRIGALVSVVSTLCKPPELAHILRVSDAQIFLGARRFLRHEYAQTLLAALPGLSEGRAEKLRLPTAPYLRSIWLDDADGLDWARPVEELVSRADAPDAPDNTLLAAVEREVSPGDDAVIIYTSGTTSVPKAVIHSQATVVRKPAVLAEYFLIKPTDRMMPLLPAFWVGGLTMALMILSKGATLVYPDSPATDVVLDTLKRLRVNRVNSWGALHGRLVEAAIARGIDIESIGGLGTPKDKQGAPIPPTLRSNMLGMSESFSAHSGEPFDMALPQAKAGSSGRPIDTMERRIVSPGTTKELPRGEVGELQIRGPALMTGFYKMERNQVFTPDGFYPTKDLARLDDEDHLFFVGRLGDMMKTAGANVSRLEVEAALRSLPGVELPIVVGVPDSKLGQRILAAVVPASGARLDEDSLKKALGDLLSSYKIPRRIVLIPAEEVRWTGKEFTSGSKVNIKEMTDVITERVKALELQESARAQR